MPSAGNYLVAVLSDDDGWEWHREVTLQIGEHQFVVVATGQQIVGGRWEANGSKYQKKCCKIDNFKKMTKTYRTSVVCGLKHWMGRLPRISYSTQELSSCPDTNRRPDGSTQTAATGEPCLDPGLVAGVTVFTQPRVLRSQNRTVLSWK